MRREIQLFDNQQYEILYYVSEGYSYEQISNELGISKTDVEDHLQKMLQMVDHKTTFELITWAYSNGVLK